MDKTVKQEGYLVFQETAGSGGGRFYLNREEADAAAERLLSSNIPVVVIKATRFINNEISQRLYGKKLDD